ncbi:luciferin 4-monooxygenase-like [Spodoptera frugiperda]|uniref:Luciferin 4-monooxygenase-like n=1 Tax=Spodoptera frugiperda TaxID=7108 RepID=A0A9R0EWI1_SPOFR|nr:luciferin 4-monooxygenase-like [Spodoptera frugiperda]
MPPQRRVNDAVFYYMDDLGSRIVAKSGIPSDRHHLGKLILQGLKDDPDFLLQIDGSTGESETSGSVLERSVRFALSLRKLGIKRGELMVLLAPNHLDLSIALYAGLYLGIVVCGIYSDTPPVDLQPLLAVTKPSIIVCQSDVASTAQMISLNLNLNPHIITFDKGDFCYYIDFMEMYKDDTPVEDFQCTDLDPETSTAFVVNTSGTTGVPKAIAHSHKYFAILLPQIWSKYTKFPTPTKLVLIGSPLQWSTAMTSFIRSAVLRYTRVQSSQKLSMELMTDLINKYRPTYSIFSPTLMSSLLKLNKVDLTCYEEIMLCGLPVPLNLIQEIKTLSPNTEVTNLFGMSELAGLGFFGDNPAPGSCGKQMSCFQYRLLDVDTQEEIYEPNVQGELWIKGPVPFLGCHNNAEATKELLTSDGWLKTGDIFYFDENWNYFFVERIRMQIKCFYYRMSPLEIEGVIRRHPGVLDVAVTSIPHNEWGELPVACVVPKPGAKPSAEEIKNLVKDTLQDPKRLRGGVIFMDSMPMTTTTKVHRRLLRQLALELPRV